MAAWPGACTGLSDALSLLSIKSGGQSRTALLGRAQRPCQGRSTIAFVQRQGPTRVERAHTRCTASAYDFPLRQEGGVKVYEQGRQQSKRIVAETVVRAPVEQVWRVLTDYEALPSYVPNLARCERLPNPPPGRILLRQRGCSQGALWRLEAEAVLEVQEVVQTLGRREARFTAVSGDFEELSGRWVVEPDPSAAAGMATLLRYDISIQPRLSLPSAIVSYVVRAGLPANIKAIAQRAEALAGRRLGVSGLASWAGVEEDVALPSEDGLQGGAEGLAPAPAPQQSCEDVAEQVPTAARQSGPGAYAVEGLPSKGPFWPAGSLYAAAAPLTAAEQRRQAEQRTARSIYLGTTSVPLPPAVRGDVSLQQVLNEGQREKEALQSSYPAFGLKRSQGSAPASSRSAKAAAVNASQAAVLSPPLPTAVLPAEVHLRRLDGMDFLHRRAVAAITVDAPAADVWAVLTDYDRLAEFVPNLAISERIKLPRDAPANVVRVRQVGYKRMLYMCLHAESVLDLVEKSNKSEIQFRQVAGDLQRFQGKWMLQEGPPDTEVAAPGYYGLQTQLKYAVEMVIPRSSRMLGVMEPMLERIVFEDIPANLAALKRRVEALPMARQVAALEQRGESGRAAVLKRKASRPRLQEMAEDFAVLEGELVRCFGSEAALPTRADLREMNRTDIEKAITAHGGPALVAERLGWRLKAKSRKPRGYWDSLPNVRQEVDEFIEDSRLPAGVMPLKNDFIRAGRFDLARAIERWGGLYELADELGYGVASPSFSSTEWQEHVSEVAASTGLSGKQGLFELAAKTYKQRDSDGSGASSASSGGEDSSSSASAVDERKAANDARKKSQARPARTPREEIDAW